MFGRSLNSFEKYGRTKKASSDSMVLWKRRQEELNKVVYPAVKDRVVAEKAKMERNFTRSHRIISDDAFPPGAVVMMADKTRSLKWSPAYEGPFLVVRRNRGGAYILRDKLGETLKRTVPADQLKLIKRENGDAVIETTSYEIAKITDHRTNKHKKFEYYVHWKDPNIEPGWEPVENFDDVEVIRKYWKSVRPTRAKPSKNKRA